MGRRALLRRTRQLEPRAARTARHAVLLFRLRQRSAAGDRPMAAAQQPRPHDPASPQYRGPACRSSLLRALGEPFAAGERLWDACPGARRAQGRADLSQYPADPADANLKAMSTMEQAFQVPVGFSDHTEGIAVTLAAVALGACVIEKHFTLDRTLPGPDHLAS
ncbi:MAG: N-acetylneuraminate synthase family protein, partial [Proteobacteria bacterium]|nr:N-acetylneuraminate synthase family protein [Pseudomonadota bacterium]